jgi:hypothetical protein
VAKPINALFVFDLIIWSKMDGRNPGAQVEAQFKEQGASRYRHAGIKLKKSPGGFREIHSRPSFPVNGDKFKKGFVNKQPPCTLP